MAKEPQSGAGASHNIQLKIAFEGKPTSDIAASAYLFDAQGRLLAHGPIRDSAARLQAKELPRRPRLLIGPTLPQGNGDPVPTASMLERLGAYEPQWKFEPGRAAYEIPAIPDIVWPRWPLCRCRVTGRVVKRVVSPGGVIVETPVCNARVHICEVDRLPWIIDRLPDDLIRRIRDEIGNIILRPIPWPPVPDPGPLDPGIFDPSPVYQRARNQLSARQLLGSKLDLVALNPQPLPPQQIGLLENRSVGSLAIAQLPTELSFALSSASTQVIRQALLDNLALIRPWICRWPWLYPWFYRSDELRVVTTDDNGRFDTFISYLCAGDKPDLYFWVEYSIGGTWQTVYHPPIPCNVYWNYACGSEITIRITDPRVSGCGQNGDVIGKQIVVKTIGREVSMGEINREPSVANPTADPAKAGTIKAGWVHATRESPFAATLDPRVDFGNGLKPAGITHYRWQVRPLGSTLETDWHTIDAPINRHYRETTAPGDPVIYKSVLVGPDPAVSGQFYQIEPQLPPGGVEFEVLDEVYDLASASWVTAGYADGKYELKLELFRNVGGTMTRVNLTAEGVGIQQIQDPAPLTEGSYTTQPATNDRLLLDGGNVGGFRLVLHIDNRLCSGTIDPASVSPGNNDTKCGFQEYTSASLVTVAFQAAHPANFAYFDFDTVRVATGLPSASATGLVDDATVNGFSRSGTLFSKAVPVATMFNEGLPLGGTPCVRAAFGESLRVYALAADGYGRMSSYDAPNALGEVGLRAFALTPV